MGYWVVGQLRDAAYIPAKLFNPSFVIPFLRLYGLNSWSTLAIVVGYVISFVNCLKLLSSFTASNPLVYKYVSQLVKLINASLSCVPG